MVSTGPGAMAPDKAIKKEVRSYDVHITAMRQGYGKETTVAGRIILIEPTEDQAFTDLPLLLLAVVAIVIFVLSAIVALTSLKGEPEKKE